MSVTRWDSRFLESTKGRVLSLLRRGSRTVDEIASALGITDNAVRLHVASLERDGVVEQRGLRPTGGKPALTYDVAPAAEHMFTKAYIPVLTQLVGVLAERMAPADLEAVLRDVGRRLAAGRGRAGGDLRARAEAAATVLTELGGVVDVEADAGSLFLRGFSCPLGDAVRAHPATCQAIQSLVSQIIGEEVREQCDKGVRPRCCFQVAAQDDASRRSG